MNNLYILLRHFRLGKRLAVAGSGAEWTTIIGVVNDLRHRGREHEVEPAV